MDITQSFKSVNWLENIQNKTVTIIGAGGIGSWTALLLARTNLKEIKVYDFDQIEERNLSGQFFKKSDIGSYKIEALYFNIVEFTDKSINPIKKKFTKKEFEKELQRSDIIICAVDSIRTRKELYEFIITELRTKIKNLKTELYIDTGLSVEGYRINVLRLRHDYLLKDDLELYRNVIENLEDTPTLCSLKQTTHVAVRLASDITALLTNYYSTEKRNIPIKLQFNTKIFNWISSKFIQNE